MKRFISRKKKAQLKKIGFSVVGAVFASLLLFILGTIVIKSNRNSCAERGMTGGSLFGKCEIESNDRDEYVFDNVSYVVGNTANVPKLALLGKIEEDTLSEESKEDKQSEGILKYFNLSKNEKSSINSKVYSTTGYSEVVKNPKELREQLTIAPKKSGSDYLNAISEAIANLDSIDKKGRKVLIIYGSGLSDQGLLNFSDHDLDLLHNKSSDIVKMLKRMGEITSEKINKNGKIYIKWYNIGRVIEPQEKLSELEKDDLTEIYKEILEAMFDIEKIEFHTIADSEKGIKTNEKVKLTDIRRIKGEILISENEIKFEPNGSVFVDEGQASKELDKIAEKIRNNNAEEVLVTATAAEGDRKASEEEMIRISTERAKRIREELADRGIERSIIDAEGKGKGEYNEWDEYGNWIEANAKKNRKVTITYI